MDIENQPVPIMMKFNLNGYESGLRHSNSDL